MHGHPVLGIARMLLRLPLPVGAPPRNDRGVELDLQTHRLLTLLVRSGRPTFDQMGPERARREVDRTAGWEHKPEVASVEDRESPLPMRIYRPDTSTSVRPATIYFHGGGFVFGSRHSHDGVCRTLCQRSRSVVIAIEYRLAPEHPFPAAPEDALAAYRWVRENANELGIDVNRIAVAGDSAGGNLSAGVCQQAKRAGLPLPFFQMLFYPGTDMTRSCDSHRHFTEGFFLTQSMIDWFVACYLTDPAQRTDPRASPLVERDLSGLPAAYIITAGFDPLRDEGELYGDALRAAGVPVTVRCQESLIHGFVNFTGLIDAARLALDDAGDVLRAALWP